MIPDLMSDVVGSTASKKMIWKKKDFSWECRELAKLLEGPIKEGEFYTWRVRGRKNSLVFDFAAQRSGQLTSVAQPINVDSRQFISSLSKHFPNEN